MRMFVITKKTLLIAAIVAVVLIGALLFFLFWGGDDHHDTDIDKSNTGGMGQTASTLPYLDHDNYELEVLAGKQRELPVYNVECADKKLALTIDAAWEDDKTPFILDELDRQGIKATFFLTGIWVDQYPEHVKDIAARGHEIGNHTDTHPHMNKLNAEQMQKEVKVLDDKIEALTGKRCTTFRAPYGEYNDLGITTLRAMNYEVIQWNLDTVDWREERSTEQILNSVLLELEAGSIILCHNNGFKITDYLPQLINGAKEQGYEFVKVSELLLPGATMIDVNGCQKTAN
ncbi:polysaccharide deacetylase family protein [Christensenellaceae bacterium OttesenSCG-928-M15]|nr:polysaccharide deacetylase family protein [Christensenellaceae bacterium OttesenSCG-928-M15]